MELTKSVENKKMITTKLRDIKKTIPKCYKHLVNKYK